MRDALAHGRGRFYGVGITSARAGYYLSYALPHGGETRGVATVKVNLADGRAGAGATCPATCSCWTSSTW